MNDIKVPDKLSEIKAVIDRSKARPNFDAHVRTDNGHEPTAQAG